MELSAKITKSIYVQLESEGYVAGGFLEQAGISTHVALDSERWIPFEQMEYFLDIVSKEVPSFNAKTMALKALETRSWGLLDQVLRILQSPSEIYQDPKQFLSYFVVPDLNFEWVKREDKFSSFTLSLSRDESPLVTEYLTGALEVVSHYVKGEAAAVHWSGNNVSIDWSKKQDSFFEKKEEHLNFKPEIYKEAVEIIQNQQNEIKELRALNKLSTKNVETEGLVEDLKVLEDYFLRARQLVSLIRADSGKKKWFKEAIKRLNWDELQSLHSEKIKSIQENINKPVSTPTFKKEEEQMGFQMNLQ